MKTNIKKPKKTIEDYMKLPYRMVIVPDEEDGGYTLYFPDLPGCVTCVESLDEAKALSEDAKREWLMAAIEDGVDIKEPQEEYSGKFFGGNYHGKKHSHTAVQKLSNGSSVERSR